MKWEQLPVGPLSANCYCLYYGDRCVIIDPGEDGEKIADWINHQQLSPEAILLTHAHFDHIGAVDYIRDKYQIPVYIHEKEADWLNNPALNGSRYFTPHHVISAKKADHLINGEGNLKIGSFEFQVLETPGHSPGSVSFYVKEMGTVISGDALFRSSIGRTDLPGGDFNQLIQSITEKLLILPENTVVLPGHGPETVIEYEKRTNPFLISPHKYE